MIPLILFPCKPSSVITMVQLQFWFLSSEKYWKKQVISSKQPSTISFYSMPSSLTVHKVFPFTHMHVRTHRNTHADGLMPFGHLTTEWKITSIWRLSRIISMTQMNTIRNYISFCFMARLVLLSKVLHKLNPVVRSLTKSHYFNILFYQKIALKKKPQAKWVLISSSVSIKYSAL